MAPLPSIPLTVHAVTGVAVVVSIAFFALLVAAKRKYLGTADTTATDDSTSTTGDDDGLVLPLAAETSYSHASAEAMERDNRFSLQDMFVELNQPLSLSSFTRECDDVTDLSEPEVRIIVTFPTASTISEYSQDSERDSEETAPSIRLDANTSEQVHLDREQERIVRTCKNDYYDMIDDLGQFFEITEMIFSSGTSMCSLPSELAYLNDASDDDDVNAVSVKNAPLDAKDISDDLNTADETDKIVNHADLGSTRDSMKSMFEIYAGETSLSYSFRFHRGQVSSSPSFTGSIGIISSVSSKSIFVIGEDEGADEWEEIPLDDTKASEPEVIRDVIVAKLSLDDYTTVHSEETVSPTASYIGDVAGVSAVLSEANAFVVTSDPDGVSMMPDGVFVDPTSVMKTSMTTPSISNSKKFIYIETDNQLSAKQFEVANGSGFTNVPDAGDYDAFVHASSPSTADVEKIADVNAPDAAPLAVANKADPEPAASWDWPNKMVASCDGESEKKLVDAPPQGIASGPKAMTPSAIEILQSLGLAGALMDEDDREALAVEVEDVKDGPRQRNRRGIHGFQLPSQDLHALKFIPSDLNTICPVSDFSRLQSLPEDKKANDQQETTKSVDAKISTSKENSTSNGRGSRESAQYHGVAGVSTEKGRSRSSLLLSDTTNIPRNSRPAPPTRTPSKEKFPRPPTGRFSMPSAERSSRGSTFSTGSPSSTLSAVANQPNVERNVVTSARRPVTSTRDTLLMRGTKALSYSSPTASTPPAKKVRERRSLTDPTASSRARTVLISKPDTTKVHSGSGFRQGSFRPSK